jgi:hypothetical protein
VFVAVKVGVTVGVVVGVDVFVGVAVATAVGLGGGGGSAAAPAADAASSVATESTPAAHQATTRWCARVQTTIVSVIEGWAPSCMSTAFASRNPYGSSRLNLR